MNSIAREIAATIKLNLEGYGLDRRPSKALENELKGFQAAVEVVAHSLAQDLPYEERKRYTADFIAACGIVRPVRL